MVFLSFIAVCSSVMLLCVKVYAVCRNHLCIANVREYVVQDTFPLQMTHACTDPVLVHSCSVCWIEPTLLEVSILGTCLRAPTSGAMEALRRVTRYLLGTQNAYVKLRIQSGDPITVELAGYSDSDWAGDPSSSKSESNGHVEADGCPLTSFSRRQTCVATSSSLAEYHAMCSTAAELLHLRTILEHFGFTVNTTLYCDSVAARGIAQRAGLGKVKALAVKTLWLQEVVRERGPQIKSTAWKGKKAALGTKGVAGGEAEHVAGSMWYCGTRRIVETYN